jgi:hypothetical protein
MDQNRTLAREVEKKKHLLEEIHRCHLAGIEEIEGEMKKVGIRYKLYRLTHTNTYF